MSPRHDHLRVGACLSLSGRYARFGKQAANALHIWRSLDGNAGLTIKDDASDPKQLATLLPQIAEETDIVLGPYSTQLMKHAGRIAVENGLLLWNHGGSGDDVETGFPGHVISILTPTTHYADPFLRHLSSNKLEPAPLWVVEGKGSFGKQVANGAERLAKEHGVKTRRIDAANLADGTPTPKLWDMLSAGTFENDIQTVTIAQNLPDPPRTICAVAAGVQDFANEIKNPDGTFGVGQWFRYPAREPELGPPSETFLSRYANAFGTSNPDYPAIQATAAAVIASHCARDAGTTAHDALWSTAASLKTSTLFGDFGIDPDTGMQLRHQATLTRWIANDRVHQL